MRGRVVIWGALVTAMVLLLGAFAVPGWILVAVVIVAFPLGIAASVKQKRMERRFVRRVWKTLTRG